MSKVTKKELLRRIEALEKFAKYADDMLTELNHALPDPEYDAKCEENAVAAEESLARHAVRLGLVKPTLKQLDQSVFDGLDKKWRFAAVDSNGEANLYTHYITTDSFEFAYCEYLDFDYKKIGTGYDASNWKESLIEREKELTGSDLCRAMLERGDRCIMCLTSCVSDENAILKGRVETVISEAASTRWNFETVDDLVIYAIPINNKGEPLTQSEFGL